MPDRDLILGVLGVQAGFLTPTQVMSAAATWLVDRDGASLLTRLERDGVLSSVRRGLLEAMVDEALAAAGGDTSRTLERLGGDAAVRSTFGGDTPLGPAVRPAALADAERPVPAERPGQYTRLDELGHGAGSTVRRAVDEFVGREVALKELRADVRPGSDGSTATRARFLREARLTAQLDHPGIVAVHELASRPDGTLFCAQKLVRGETLKARLARCETLEQRLALLEHIVDACDAVAYAHAQGVIHRDLKPSNIMVGGFGETVVVDWGLAKKRGEADPAGERGAAASAEPALTVDGVALGTPAYMSPEQARGALAATDERSDVFSLGVILYELLTGRLPFEGLNAGHVMEKVLQGRFPPVRTLCPAAPRELAAIAERALSAEPERRYAGAGPLAEELRLYRSGGRVSAYEYGSWELARKFVARNRGLTAVSAVALLVLVGASVTIARQLAVARSQLAVSFLERARAAEERSDWARAAGYYAASRVEHDSRAARWGHALARQKIARRVLSRRGADGSAMDVTYLAGGRAVSFGVDGSKLSARGVDDGAELWRVDLPAPPDGFGVVGSRQLRVTLGNEIRYLDAASGGAIATFTLASRPCPGVAVPTRVFLRQASGTLPDLVVDDGGGAPRTLATELLRGGLCTVSPDGARAAALDGDGVAHIWDVATGAELASRPARDAGLLLFTPHGLAAVRSRAVHVFGPEGDFFVTIPNRGGNGYRYALGATASPDGHVIVVPRLGASQADVIDLRARTVTTSLVFATGAPRFAVSPDGEQLLVGGLENGGLLAGFAIGAPAPRAIAGSSLMGIMASRDSGRIMVKRHGRTSFGIGVHDASGALVRDYDLGPGPRANATLSDDGRRIALYLNDRVRVLETDSGTTLTEMECKGCMRVTLDEHGERLLSNNGAEVTLWEVARREILWRDAARAGALGQPLAITNDGRRIAWGRGGTLYFHEVGKGDAGELRIDDTIEDAQFSNDGRRMVVTSRRVFTMVDVDGPRELYRRANPAAVAQEMRFSADDTTLINTLDSLGTALYDSGSGERIAMIPLSRPAALGASDIVTPDLRYRIARGDATWDISPLPPLDDSSPEESLARVLAEAGLEMRGVELVYAAPP